MHGPWWRSPHSENAGLDADSPDEAKIVAQVDPISPAQAELRKDEIRMQLAARQILGADQWRKMQEHPGSPNQPPLARPNQTDLPRAVNPGRPCRPGNNRIGRGSQPVPPSGV